MDWLKAVNSIKVRTSDLTKDAILVASLSNENGQVPVIYTIQNPELRQ